MHPRSGVPALKTGPYYHTLLAFARFSIVSLNPGLINSAVLLLSITFAPRIALTIDLGSPQNWHSILPQSPCLTGIQHSRSHTSSIDPSFHLQWTFAQITNYSIHRFRSHTSWNVYGRNYFSNCVAKRCADAKTC